MPFSQSGGALLFHLLSKLYEHTSGLITTNLSIVETGNESYRLQHSTLAAQTKIKSRERKRKDGDDVEDDEPF